MLSQLNYYIERYNFWQKIEKCAWIVPWEDANDSFACHFIRCTNSVRLCTAVLPLCQLTAWMWQGTEHSSREMAYLSWSWTFRRRKLLRKDHWKDWVWRGDHARLSDDPAPQHETQREAAHRSETELLSARPQQWPQEPIWLQEDILLL